MQIVRQQTKLVNVEITFRPDGDGPSHVANVSKAPDQHRHVANVRGIVPPLNEALPNQRHVRRKTLQLNPGLLVACGNRDLGKILLIVTFQVAGGVVGQTEDCSFFGFRPEAFTAYICADARQNLRAEDSKIENADHDGHEDGNNDLQLSRGGKSVKHPALNAHSGAWEAKLAGVNSAYW